MWPGVVQKIRLQLPQELQELMGSAAMPVAAL
jgi:hypothetical protein